MKNLFLKVREQLNTITDIKWVDLDKGQFNFENPPVEFPCALITIQAPTTVDIDNQGNIQQNAILLTIKLAFNYTGDTHNFTPAQLLEKSLEYFDLADQVFNVLNGFEDIAFTRLERQSQIEEPRTDMIKVIRIPFATSLNQRKPTD